MDICGSDDKSLMVAEIYLYLKFSKKCRSYSFNYVQVTASYVSKDRRIAKLFISIYIITHHAKYEI